MKAYLNYITLLTGLLFGLLIGIKLFGEWVHEAGHALACAYFNIPYKMSATQVSSIEITGLPKIVVGLSGGLMESFVALLFFALISLLEKYGSKWFLLAMGFEVAFLTIALKGIINAILEGLFNDVYKQIYANELVAFTLYSLGMVLFSFLILKKKSKKFNALAVAESL